MAFTTTSTFGPISSYKKYVTVIARVSGSDTVEIQLEIDTNDWESVHIIDANSADKAVRIYPQGGSFRVVPTGSASFSVRGV